MEFKHRRGDFLIMFDRFTGMPLLILAVIVSIFVFKDFDPSSLVPVLIVAASPIWGLVNYFTTYYTLEDEHLIIETGVFTKERKVIPYRVITTVDLTQNILFQIRSTYKIKIDDSSQTRDAANKAEVVLALKDAEAHLFKQIITGKKLDELSEDGAADKLNNLRYEDENAIEAKIGDFVKLGFLQSKIIYFFAIAPVLAPLLFAIVSLTTGITDPEVLLDNLFSDVYPAVVVILFVSFFYLTALGGSLMKSIFTYYNFKISSNAESLKIEYGLLSKKKLALQKTKINGIVLKQSLLMRLFKCYTAEILVIGYGDKSDDKGMEQAIIFPIASLEKISEIVNRFLPEFEFKVENSKQKRSFKILRYFFYKPLFASVLLLFAASFFMGSIIPIIVMVIVLAFSIVSITMQFFNTNILSGRKNITIWHGGYHRNIAVIKTSSVESITANGSILKRRNGIVSISLGFIAPLRSSKIVAQNMTIEQFKSAENSIYY